MKSTDGKPFCGSHTGNNPEAYRPWQTQRLLDSAAVNLVDRSTAEWILDHQVVPGEILPPSQGETVHIIAQPVEQKPYDWAKDEPQLYDWEKECPELMAQPNVHEQQPLRAGMPVALGRSAMWPVAVFLNGLTPMDK